MGVPRTDQLKIMQLAQIVVDVKMQIGASSSVDGLFLHFVIDERFDKMFLGQIVDELIWRKTLRGFWQFESQIGHKKGEWQFWVNKSVAVTSELSPKDGGSLWGGTAGHALKKLDDFRFHHRRVKITSGNQCHQFRAIPGLIKCAQFFGIGLHY